MTSFLMMRSSGRASIALAVLVWAAAAHSVVLGIVLLVAPLDLFAAFHWNVACDHFFLRQVGVFHVLLGMLYGLEWHRHRTVSALILAKIVATIFLFVFSIISKAELGMILAGCADAFIAGAAIALLYLIHRLEKNR